MTDPKARAEWPDARIVIIDDEEPIRRMLEQLLAATGYTQVRSFGDPVDALDALDAFAPDLTLLDLHMPRMEGFDVLRRLQLMTDEPRAPVVVMTGGGRSEDVHRTLELGAADFLHKPVDGVELLLRVRHQLRERRLRHELAEHNRTLEDLAERRAGELALLSRVLDDIPVAAAVLEPGLELRYANTLGRQLLPSDSTDLPAALSTGARERDELTGFLRSATSYEPVSRLCTIGGRGETARRVEVEVQRVQGELIAVLVHDTEERERATDALRRALELEQRANEDLRKVEQLRTHFLGAVSHELRTPLTIVLGMAESLERHHASLNAEQQLALLSRLHGNARRLGRLLDDLLDLNRLVAGQLEVRSTAHDLAEIVEDALAEFELGSHPLTVDVPPIPVDVEASRIRRVVANLVRNAIVHTQKGTAVHVAGEQDEVCVRLRVVDRGPGVADDLKRRIFEPFEQGPSAPKHQPGTGIGLSLVREFVRLHGGRVWVEDTPGGGATFVVELPRPSRRVATVS